MNAARFGLSRRSLVRGALAAPIAAVATPAFAGLDPHVRESADIRRNGHVTKSGPPLLRWALQQAAWVAYRCDSDARRIICRIARRSGLNKAVTAYARKLLTYARSVIHRDQPFVRPGAVPPPVQTAAQQQEGAWCYAI